MHFILKRIDERKLREQKLIDERKIREQKEFDADLVSVIADLL